jgi:hypothetical protein
VRDGGEAGIFSGVGWEKGIYEGCLGIKICCSYRGNVGMDWKRSINVAFVVAVFRLLLHFFEAVIALMLELFFRGYIFDCGGVA